MKKLCSLAVMVVLATSLVACATHSGSTCGCGHADKQMACSKDCKCGCHESGKCTCGEKCECAKHGTSACTCNKK